MIISVERTVEDYINSKLKLNKKYMKKILKENIQYQLERFKVKCRNRPINNDIERRV